MSFFFIDSFFLEQFIAKLNGKYRVHMCSCARTPAAARSTPERYVCSDRGVFTDSSIAESPQSTLGFAYRVVYAVGFDKDRHVASERE